MIRLPICGLQREPGEQLRLAADFEPEVERLARVQDLFHHFAQLVHLDRETRRDIRPGN